MGQRFSLLLLDVEAHHFRGRARARTSIFFLPPIILQHKLGLKPSFRNRKSHVRKPPKGLVTPVGPFLNPQRREQTEARVNYSPNPSAAHSHLRGPSERFITVHTQQHMITEALRRHGLFVCLFFTQENRGCFLMITTYIYCKVNS